MNESLIVKPSLDKARIDLDDAMHALGAVWAADDHDSIEHLTCAAEGLIRAIYSVSLAVERLAELVVD